MKTSLLIALTALTLAQGGQVVTLRPEKGQQIAYGLTLELGGENGVLVRTDVDWRVADVRADGSVLIEQTVKNARTMIDNQEIKFDDVQLSNFSFAKNGALLAMSKPGIRAEDYRMQRIVSVVVPSDPVGRGMSWSIEGPANSATGALATEHKFKAAGEEIVKAEPCVVIEIDARETTGQKPMHAKGKAWMSVRDGLPRRLTLQIENAPMGQGGSPLAVRWNQEMREW